MQTLKLTLLGALAFAVLDGLWLGVVMKGFYRERLAPIARMEGGGLAPVWAAALPVYVLLGFGLALFVVPRAATVPEAALLGAALGLVVYGVYDLTNYATLKDWPLAVTAADIAWGTAASAAAGAALRAFAR